MRTLPAMVTTAAFVSLTALCASAQEQPMIGVEAPDFSLESLDGETVSLTDFRGQLVVLHFGAGW